jgi:hypothetical protein
LFTSRSGLPQYIPKDEGNEESGMLTRHSPSQIDRGKEKPVKIPALINK